MGYAPVAPGTAGALVGLAVYFLLPPGPICVALAFAVSFSAGVWAASLAPAIWPDRGADPGRVCIDEFAGLFVAVLFLPRGLLYGVAGFLAFRFFDVVKPFPARACEKLPRGWGIMTDDLVAALYANLCVQVARVVLAFVL